MLGRYGIVLDDSFNPCFNGSMYKNSAANKESASRKAVSILVLMDLCIKTLPRGGKMRENQKFQSLF